MKLKYIRHTVKKGGQRETFAEEFDKDRVVLGRGGKSDLRFESSSIAPEHAAIYQQAGEIFIEDLTSIGGTFVNKQAINKARRLAGGDVIKIGEITFSLQCEADSSLLLEQRVETEQETVSDRAQRLAGQVDLNRVLPRLSRLSWLLVLIGAISALVLPFSGSFQTQWSSGPISKSHGMIASDCRACHSQGFVQVQDRDCLSCHKLTAHVQEPSKSLDDSALSEPRCAECHMEHNGAHGLIISDPRVCGNCHHDLSVIAPRTKLRNVTSFGDHPQFALPDSDKAHIKLNHKLHLEPDLRGKTGTVTLQCKDCHELSENYRTLEPINYEKHCSDCHGLEFDERLPEKTVPHGEPDTVYNSLYAEYAKYLLDVQDEQASATGFERFRPGKTQTPEERTEYVKKYVEAESRVAERLLFTRTACFLCHDMTRKENYKVSAYSVEKPDIPQRWLAGSIFSHGAHEEIKCESCHDQARKSEATADVLLPQIDNCRSCHTDPAHQLLPQADGIRSECITCHSYHDSRELPNEAKRDVSSLIRRIASDN